MRTRLLAALGISLLMMSGFAASRTVSGDKMPERPKITGIDHVRLYVSNEAKSREFYSGVMGMPAGVGNCAGDSRPCFAVNASQYVELEAVPSPAPRNWVAEIAFATDDAERLRNYLSVYGVSATAVTTESGVSRFEVRDPEGNRIAFVQRSTKAADFKTSPKQIGTRMIHAGFVVKDMKAENKFYRDILGFRVYWYGGFKDNDIDWYELQMPDGGDWLEYMLNIPANADHKEMGEQNHFSVGVKDADAAAEQFKNQGWKKLDGPEVGRDGKNSIDAFDPDGTRVEVMEFAPRQTPCCHAYEAAHPTP